MQMRYAGLFRKADGIFEHRFRFGRKTGDHIGAKAHLRPKTTNVIDETNGVGA